MTIKEQIEIHLAPSMDVQSECQRAIHRMTVVATMFFAYSLMPMIKELYL